MGSRSREERERWLQFQEALRRQKETPPPPTSKDQLRQLQRPTDDGVIDTNAKLIHRQPQRERVAAVHDHFMCTCLACAQEFEICGLPCFVICPNCHLTLRLNYPT